jgi:transcriptional regulator GlxA family with amidase domain
MKYVVLRVPTNSQGDVVPSVIGTYSDKLAAESHFHEEVAEAATKVNSAGRLCDGAYLLTDDGVFIDSKFYKAETPTPNA